MYEKFIGETDERGKKGGWVVVRIHQNNQIYILIKICIEEQVRGGDWVA